MFTRWNRGLLRPPDRAWPARPAFLLFGCLQLLWGLIVIDPYLRLAQWCIGLDCLALFLSDSLPRQEVAWAIRLRIAGLALGMIGGVAGLAKLVTSLF